MADTKLTALGAIGTLGDDDIFYVVDAPGGTPLSKKVTALVAKTFVLTPTVTMTSNATAVTPPADTQLHLVGNNSQEPRFTLDAFANVGIWIGRRANNTAASLDALNSGDSIVGLEGRGYGATAYSTGRVGLAFVASQDWTDTAHGTQASIYTTPNNSTTPSTGFLLSNGGQISNGETPIVFGSGITPDLQVLGTSDGTSKVGVARFSADGSGPMLAFGKARGAALGTYTVPNDGDTLAEIEIWGADNTDWAKAGRIRFAVNGAPGAGDMPTRFEVYTSADGSETPTQRFAIDGSGKFIVGEDVDSTSPRLNLNLLTSTTASALNMLHMNVRTSGTAANGFGGLINWRLENASGNDKDVMSLSAVYTDVTNGSEDVDCVFSLIAAGVAPAEKFRIRSTGRLESPTAQVAHFWVYWTGNSTTILASHNVASIDDDAVGDAGVNLTTAFNSNNYAAFVATNDSTNGWDNEEIEASGINVHTTATCDVLCSVCTDGTTAATSLNDPDQWQVAGWGVSA